MPKKAQATDSAAEIDAQIQQLIAGIDAQIASLQAKKDALVKVTGGAPAATVSSKRRGRPPAAAKATKATKATKAKKGKKKRTVSPETRAILSAKATARWAAKKKAQSKAG